MGNVRLGKPAREGGRMTCLSCASLSLENKAMASCGFGRCKHDANQTFTGISSSKCKKFIKAPDDIVQKRITWKEGRK